MKRERETKRRNGISEERIKPRRNGISEEEKGKKNTGVRDEDGVLSALLKTRGIALFILFYSRKNLLKPH